MQKSVFSDSLKLVDTQTLVDSLRGIHEQMSEMDTKVFQPALWYSQYPKAGQNTQHSCLTITEKIWSVSG